MSDAFVEGASASKMVSDDELYKIAESEGFSKEDVRHNMVAVVLLDSAYNMGWADLALVMQPLLVFLAASNKTIGFVTGATFLGLIGVFLSPFITRKFRIKKYYFFTVNVFYLSTIALTALTILFKDRLQLDNADLLKAVVVLTGIQWALGGFCTLPSIEYTAACIPSSFRGRLMGYSLSIGGVAALAAAWLGGWMLLKLPKPGAFGYILLTSWFICQIGFIAALFAREQPTPVEKSPAAWSKKMVVAAWRDKPFMRALVFFFLYQIFFNTAFPFINVYGLKGLKMALAFSAVFQMITQIVRIVVATPAGSIIDRLTPRRILPYCFPLAFLAWLPPILIPNQWGVFMGVAMGAAFWTVSWTAWTALLYAIPSPENRGGHFSIQLIVQYATYTIGSLGIGALCDVLDYRIVFAMYAVVALVMYPITRTLLKGVEHWRAPEPKPEEAPATVPGMAE